MGSLRTSDRRKGVGDLGTRGAERVLRREGVDVVGFDDVAIGAGSVDGSGTPAWLTRSLRLLRFTRSVARAICS